MVNIVSTLKTMINKLINLNNTKLDIATMQALYGTKTKLTATWTKKGSWTNDPTALEAYLMGDKIYLYFNITRGSAYSAGNITNEDIGAINIQTLGAISAAFAYSTTSALYGGMPTINIANSITGSGASQVLTVTPTLCACHRSASQIVMHTAIPVQPNLAYYGIS